MPISNETDANRNVAKKQIAQSFRGILRISPTENGDGGLDTVTTVSVSDSMGNLCPLKLSQNAVEVDGSFSANTATITNLTVPTLNATTATIATLNSTNLSANILTVSNNSTLNGNTTVKSLTVTDNLYFKTGSNQTTVSLTAPSADDFLYADTAKHYVPTNFTNKVTDVVQTVCPKVKVAYLYVDPDKYVLSENQYTGSTQIWGGTSDGTQSKWPNNNSEAVLIKYGDPVLNPPSGLTKWDAVEAKQFLPDTLLDVVSCNLQLQVRLGTIVADPDNQAWINVTSITSSAGGKNWDGVCTSGADAIIDDNKCVYLLRGPHGPFYEYGNTFPYRSGTTSPYKFFYPTYRWRIKIVYIDSNYN